MVKKKLLFFFNSINGKEKLMIFFPLILENIIVTVI